MHEHERRARAGPFVLDLEPATLDDVHRRKAKRDSRMSPWTGFASMPCVIIPVTTK